MDARSASHRSSLTRALAAWVGVWLLLWQTAFAAGLIERPMAPVSAVDGALVVCTEHGATTLPSDGAPGHAPADHSGPSCPCCLPFAAGHGGAILPVAIAIPLPVAIASAASIPGPRRPHSLAAAHAPQQPRAPPLSV
jgi:hypothetical protein